MKNCQLPTCAKPLARRTGEIKSSYLRRKYCDRTCVNRALSLKLTRPINHGTVSGYNVHLRRGETPCTECHNARLEWQRERYPESSERQKATRKIRRQAMQIVVKAHYEEYVTWIEKLEAS